MTILQLFGVAVVFAFLLLVGAAIALHSYFVGRAGINPIPKPRDMWAAMVGNGKKKDADEDADEDEAANPPRRMRA